MIMKVGKTWLVTSSGASYQHIPTCEERYDTATEEYQTCLDDQKAGKDFMICALAVTIAIIIGIIIWSVWERRKW